MHMTISSDDQPGTRLQVTQQQANWLITQLSQAESRVRVTLEREYAGEPTGETARGEFSRGYEVRR